MRQFPTVAVIGVGNMGESIVNLALADRWPEGRLTLTHRRAERRAELQERYERPVESDNRAAVTKSDIVILCVRPQDVVTVLHELNDVLNPGQVFISVVAALDIPWLSRYLPKGISIVRAVPPPASSHKLGTTFLSADDETIDIHREIVELLFQPMCGRILWIPDANIDVLTAIGPGLAAYLCLILQALIQVGIDEGVPPELARDVATHGAVTASRMIPDSDTSPHELLEKLATHEGLAWAALKTMEKHGVAGGIRAGAYAMIARSMELRGDQVPRRLQHYWHMA